MSDVLAAVINTRDADQRSMVPIAAELKRLLPSLPVLVQPLADEPTPPHELAALAHIPGLVVLADHTAATLLVAAQRQIASAGVQSPGAALLAAISAVEPPLHPLIAGYLRTVISQARWPLSVRGAMNMLDPTKRRSLDHLLMLAHLPTAEQLIGWVFALHATWLLALPGSTFEAVARQLGFNDASALRSVIAHRAGMPPREVMRNGGFAYLLRRFVALLHGDWSREPSDRRSRARTQRARMGD